jgi:hypothetical protein
VIILDDIVPTRLISANRRIHHMVRSQVCLYWRDLAAKAAEATYGKADVGETWHQRVRIVITVRYPNGRGIKDPGNLYPYVAKPIVDGLVDARLVPDDDYRHVIGPDLRRDPEHGPHRVVIDIQDLNERNAA